MPTSSAVEKRQSPIAKAEAPVPGNLFTDSNPMKHKKKLVTLAGIAVLLAYRLSPDSYPVYPASDHYDSQTQTFYNYEPQRPVADVGGALWKMIVDEKSTHPPKPLPTLVPDWQTFAAAADKSRFVWLGHSTLLMRIGSQTIVTDPVFGKRVSPVPLMTSRFQPPPAPFEALPPIDVVLISHNHYDHLEEATIKKIARKDSQFIVSLGLGVILRKWGVPPERITELDWWQSSERNGVRYTAVPARHHSGRGPFDRNKTLWSTFVIEHGGERFYYGSDSSHGRHFDEIARRFNRFDIAFIESGQYNERWPDNHLFPEQAAEIAAKLQAKRFMPIHWGAYSIALHSWNDPVLRGIPAARKLGLDPLTPVLGQVFDAETPTRDWFAE